MLWPELAAGFPGHGSAQVTEPIFTDLEASPVLAKLDAGNEQEPALRNSTLDDPDRYPPNIFGSVALRVARTSYSQQWRALMLEQAQSYLKGPCTADDPVCVSATFKKLKRTLELTAALSERAAAEAINTAVNKAIGHSSDAELYGSSDYWAGFRNTVTRGRGDCEDIAIVKMWMLNAIGISLDRIHLVIVRSGRLPAAHAVLSVQFDDTVLVLDNLSDSAWEDFGPPRYEPILSFSVLGEWLHGFPSDPAGRRAEIFSAQARNRGEPASGPASRNGQ
jgi:predicted transglutaminase-like cysteine proteinase